MEMISDTEKRLPSTSTKHLDPSRISDNIFDDLQDPDMQEKSHQRVPHLNYVQQKQTGKSRYEQRILKRRERFQAQKQKDESTLQERIQLIQDQQQLDRTKRIFDRKQQRIDDESQLKLRGLALSTAVIAAKAQGLPSSSHVKPSRVRHHQQIIMPASSTSETQQRQQTKMAQEQGNHVTESGTLDPDDPDPWPEEEEHYMFMGRLTRIESLQAMYKARTNGEKYELPVYNPTGIDKQEKEPILSRHGQGISVHGTLLAATVSNAKVKPTGHQFMRLPPIKAGDIGTGLKRKA